MGKPYGVMMGGPDAVKWLEALPNSLPDKVKTDEFMDGYYRVLHRIQYEVDRSEPVAPKTTEPICKGYSRFYNCGDCGFTLRADTYDRCPKCGRTIKWSAAFPERWP